MHQFSQFLHTIVLFSLLFFLGCSEEKQTQQKRTIPPQHVNTITVTKEPIAIWKSYTGTTQASSTQEVRARVAGTLEEVYFKDGQEVKKGDKLFKIEQTEYSAKLDAAKAAKAVDEAALNLAYADVQRYTPLVQEGLAPRATLEQYQAQVAKLKASIAGNIAQIKKAELELSYTIIKAPISGKISARRIDVGNVVGQGDSTLLTTITKIDPLYAYFSPSQDDVRMFNTYRDKNNPDAFIEIQGSQGTIRLDGYVDFANNVVDSLTSTLTMRATIHNPHKKIFAGTFVYVNIFVNDTYEFLMVPPESILTDQLGKFMYIVDDNSKAKRVDIETNYSEKHYVSVSKGLKSGDKIIVSALVKIKPKTKVIANDVTDEQGIQAVLKKYNLFPSKKD